MVCIIIDPVNSLFSPDIVEVVSEFLLLLLKVKVKLKVCCGIQHNNVSSGTFNS